MTSTKAIQATKSARHWKVGVAASLMLAASPLALHAETSNSDLAKQIAELKAQIRSMKGSIAETRTEARRSKKVVVERVVQPAPLLASVPPGAVPVYATADKKMLFGNLTITPGGYVQMDGIYRTRDTQATVTTPYNGIPTLNNNQAHVAENRFSVQQSRAALLIEAPITPKFLVAGYGEVDFNTQAINSNINQTNAFVLRVRNLYATLDATDYGMHVLAGQNWSLITLNSKGITPRNELLPPGNDSGVLVGYDYARTPQIRLTKDFNQKLWLAVSVENPGSTGDNSGGCGNVVSNVGGAVAGITPNGFTGVAGGTCLATGLGQQGTQTQFSLNQTPDVLGKVAYEATIANRAVHLEATGIYQNFTSYTNYGILGPAAGGGSFTSSSNQQRSAPGVEGGIAANLIPLRLDFQASGYYGYGLGRFTSSGLPTATVTGDGRLKPLLGASANAGLIFHATPSFDIYGFAGFDQVNRNYTTQGGAEVGYGANSGVNNTGCYSVGGTCGGATRRVFELTGGFNDKIYKGTFGEVRVGVQYEYIQRQLFGASTTANAAGGPAGPVISARTSDHVVFSTLRYFPFQ